MNQDNRQDGKRMHRTNDDRTRQHSSGNGRPVSERQGSHAAQKGPRTGKYGPSSPRQGGNRPPRQRPFQETNAKQARDKNALPSPGRRAALKVIGQIYEDKAFISLALDACFEKEHMPQVEKRFCTSLTHAVIENQYRIDYVLDQFLKDKDNLNPQIIYILRMAIAQKLFMDRVPDSAIADEAVRLARNCGLEGMTGLVNAVTRNIFRALDSDFKWPERETDPVEYVRVMYSVPKWLAVRLAEEYGQEEAERICGYRGTHPMVIRPNQMQYASASDFKARVLDKKVWETEKAPWLDAFYVRGAADISRDADYSQGGFSIEGISSMLDAEAVQVRPGERVLDCCAAPGGKTAYMAEAMKGSGRVYAWDVHDHRVALIRAMSHRLHLDNVRPMVRDASLFREDMEDSMDAVLLDAPCTGLGVMDNKPDIKYKVTPEQVEELSALQEKLLDTCSRYVRRGGTLVYSTCSLLKEENENRIRQFLQTHPEFSLDTLPASFGETLLSHCGPFGLQILPHRDGGLDGFFIARMRRK